MHGTPDSSPNKAPDDKKEVRNRKRRPPSGVPLSWWFVFIAVAILIASILLSNPSTPANAPSDESEVVEPPEENAQIPTSRQEAFDMMLENGSTAVLVNDQAANSDRVQINEVVLTQSGFVAVHEDSGGVPGNVIGVSDLIEERQTSVEVPLLKGELESGEVYYAVVYTDNGDGNFLPPNDAMVTGSDGSVASMSFAALSETEE